MRREGVVDPSTLKSADYYSFPQEQKGKVRESLLSGENRSTISKELVKRQARGTKVLFKFKYLPTAFWTTINYSFSLLMFTEKKTLSKLFK